MPQYASRNPIGRLDPLEWGAYQKIFHFSGIAGYEDYKRCNVAIRPVAIDAPVPDASAAPLIKRKILTEYFPQGDTGTGSIIQLTVTTVYQVFERAPSKWEKEMMVANKGHSEWSVAAMLLGLNSLHPAFLRWIVAARYHHLPLLEWRAAFKGWLVAVRRCPILLGIEHVDPAEILAIRKVLNCTFRSKEQADWAAEKHRRMVNMPVHWGLRPDGMLCRSTWLRDQWDTCITLANEVVGATVARARVDDLDTWWGSRWAWCPSGSSSQRHVVDHVVESDPVLSKAARPGKKAVFEELSDDFVWDVLAKHPPLHQARGSTKPEPGGRPRALYAVADEGFAISGYASVHIEKFMNVWGIKAKQTPADVMSWIACDRRRAPGQVWLSLDYSDYNSEHEATTLSVLNMSMALAWRNQLGNGPVASQKVACARWTAAAHQVKFVTIGDELWRPMSGLFSGDRDTARDNTALHGVYSKMALKYASLYDPDVTLVEANYTGDDEDSLMGDWVSSYTYMIAHAMMGFVLKPAKQMSSGVIHEFLQRMAVPDALPTRPLFATLAQFASGNWYKDVYSWYDTSVSSVSDNVWEMVTRGLPLLYARRLAVITLNAAMRVPTADGWHDLEWWAFRHGANDYHPLWLGTHGASRPPPTISAKPDPHPSASGTATEAWLAMKQHDLQGLPADMPAWDLYRGHCRREGYASLYVKQRARAHAKYALTQWPVRYSAPAGLHAPAPPRWDAAELSQLILASPTDRRPATEEEVISRMGLDMAMVSAFGGLTKMLPHLRPDVLAHYSQPELVGYAPVMVQWEDSAVRAWYGCSAMGKIDSRKHWVAKLEKRYPRRKTAAEAMTVYVSPNAGGKSWFSADRPACCDFDEVARRSGYRAAIRARAGQPLVPVDEGFRDFVSLLVTSLNYTEMTTQTTLSMLFRPPNERNYSLNVVVVDVCEELLIPRMAERGWPNDKIARRLARWRRTREQVVLESTRMLGSRDTYKMTRSWPATTAVQIQKLYI